MKALTDKIIDTLKSRHDQFIGSQKNRITQAENKGYKQGLLCAIETIEALESSAEFEEVVRVVMKHLGNRTDLYSPHNHVILNNTYAELLQGQKVIDKINDYIKD